MAYTEPSLFYVPWRKHQKPYGEYITVQFETLECTFEDWQRDPVFAVYKADDTEYKNPIYCTALYDNDNNMVRNGIIQRRFFNVCSEYGSAANPVILPSGKYKIKMLCSGSGMITNGVEEWEFNIERGTSGKPIYSGSIIDYSYRDIVIDPFKGYKYLQIDCEIGDLITELSPSEIADFKVLQTMEIPSIINTGTLQATIIDKYSKPIYEPMLFDISTVDEISNNSTKTKYYKAYACFNEYVIDNRTGNSQQQYRGKKEIINNENKIPYNKNAFLKFKDKNPYILEYVLATNADLFDYGFRVGNAQDDFECLYKYFYCGEWSEDSWDKPNAKININNFEIRDVDVQSFSTEVTTRDWNFVFYDELGEPNWYKTAGITFNLKYYEKCSDVEKSQYNEVYDGIGNPPTQDFAIYNEKNELFKDNIKDAIDKQLSESSYMRENSCWIRLPFSYLLSNTNPIPPISTSKHEYRNWEVGYSQTLHEGEYIGYITSGYGHGENRIEYIQYPSTPTIIDLGVDWKGYDNYEDTTKWSGTRLYNSELEVYHPELIPKEKAGET